jgi:acyl carrier protein
MKTTTIIRNFIIENFLFGDGNDLEETTDFFKTGIINSTGIIELISYIEEMYNITVEDNELNVENFRTLSAVCQYIERKTDCSLAV